MAHQQRKYGPAETLERIKLWCDLQERAQQEVRDKLYDWGLHHDEVETCIVELITGNFISEERFARAYVSGKFRIKRWGRMKILNGLHQKKVSKHCVQLGLQEIDEQEYLQTAQSLIEKKFPLIKAQSDWERKQKLAAYLARRGYEIDVVWDQIDRFLNKQENDE